VKRTALAATLSAALTGAAAQTAPLDALTRSAIMDAVWSQQRAFANNNLRSITAYYVSTSGGCHNVSVETSGRMGLEHYRVCDGQIEPRPEVEPAPPNSDTNYRRAVVFAGRQALSNGSARSQYEEYTIEAKRAGPPDSRGCSIIEINISFDGMLVDHGEPRVCQ
jgi:hypothetical protein